MRRARGACMNRARDTMHAMRGRDRREDLLRDGPGDPREVLPDQDPRPLLHPLRRWGRQVLIAS